MNRYEEVKSGLEHLPVLLRETLELLAPRPGLTYVDCTVGAGGHSREIAARIGPSGRLVGIDRDPQALVTARHHLQPYLDDGRAVLVEGSFGRLEEILAPVGVTAADGFLFDLGLSSMQVDIGERGFSYWEDAPLDMRMGPDVTRSAYELVNSLSRAELARIIGEYGEERWAGRIADFIVRARQRRAIVTTGELVEIIKAAVPAAARRRGPHPARRTFQALRIAVNGEVEELQEGLGQAMDMLRPGGRICVIAFHSLEDRIVKHCFRTAGDTGWQLLTRRPVVPGAEEIAANPRARSAKLRAIAKE